MRVEKEGRGVVRLSWVKQHIGILENEAADMLVKRVVEGVSPNGYEKCMYKRGIRQWVKMRKKEHVEGREGERVIKRAMGWERMAVTNHYKTTS